jgi:hypothetical protein
MSRQDALKSKKVFVPGRGYLKRASVTSVPKKLDHNELGVCESVPESVLASVLGSGGTCIEPAVVVEGGWAGRTR